MSIWKRLYEMLVLEASDDEGKPLRTPDPFAPPSSGKLSKPYRTTPSAGQNPLKKQDPIATSTKTHGQNITPAASGQSYQKPKFKGSHVGQIARSIGGKWIDKEYEPVKMEPNVGKMRSQGSIGRPADMDPDNMCRPFPKYKAEIDPATGKPKRGRPSISSKEVPAGEPVVWDGDDWIPQAWFDMGYRSGAGDTSTSHSPSVSKGPLGKSLGGGAAGPPERQGPKPAPPTHSAAAGPKTKEKGPFSYDLSKVIGKKKPEDPHPGVKVRKPGEKK